MVTRTWPVLQSFEKDQSRQNFVINQIASGLSSAAGGSGDITTLREPLKANRTYFVDPAGNDSNNGQSVGSPFLTVQHAIDIVYGSLDLKGFNVTIQLSNGSYGGGVSVTAPQVGAGVITINGNPTTPGNVTLTSTTATVVVQRNALLSVANLRLQSTGATGYCLVAQLSGIIQGQAGSSLIFGNAPNGAHMTSQSFGTIDLQGASYTIEGDAGFHMLSQIQGFVGNAGSAVTINTARTFVNTFAYAANLGLIYVGGSSYTGAGVAGTTGMRFSTSLNAVVYTNGAGLNFFPGSIAGSTSSGGQYI